MLSKYQSTLVPKGQPQLSDYFEDHTQPHLSLVGLTQILYLLLPFETNVSHPLPVLSNFLSGVSEIVAMSDLTSLEQETAMELSNSPDHHLPQVVWVPAEAPQPTLDVPPMVGWVLLEQRLLGVSGGLHAQADREHGDTCTRMEVG